MPKMQQPSEDSTQKIITTIIETSDSSPEAEKKAEVADAQLPKHDLPALLRRDPHVTKSRDLNFWRPYFNLYKLADDLVRASINSDNQEELLSWRKSIHNKISYDTLAWNRSSGQPFDDFINSMQEEIQTSIQDCLLAFSGKSQDEKVLESTSPSL